MSTGFYFKGFTPDGELEWQANSALSRVIDIAPYGASVSALVEQVSGQEFHAEIEIISRRGPLFANAQGADPKTAVDKLLEKTRRKLLSSDGAWAKRRESLMSSRS